MRDDFVQIPMPEDSAEWNPHQMSTRVRNVGRRDPGRTGTVVGWARGKHAHEQFTANQERARTEGRALTSDDYEPLIDSEGALVRWDNSPPDDLDWFPGQSCVIAVPVGSREEADFLARTELDSRTDSQDYLAVMTVSIPKTEWRQVYGHRGIILPRDVRQYLENALFAGTTHLPVRVHVIRELPQG